MDEQEYLKILSKVFMEEFTKFIYTQAIMRSKKQGERDERKTIIKEPVKKEVNTKDSFLMDCYTSDIMDAYNESRYDWD